MRFERARHLRPRTPPERQDDPLALAELYAALLEKSGQAKNLNTLSGPERCFLLGQRCELALRRGGFVAVCAAPETGEMARSLREMGAAQTAGMLEAALLERPSPEGYAARCRKLDARRDACESEIAVFCAAWARNHGMMP